MILVDTSVWIDHLAHGDARLQTLLEDGEVLAHPFVIGEIALGSLPRRHETLSALQALPAIDIASPDEAMAFLHGEQLFGMGIGYVDLQLLASIRLEPAARLWTRDKRLLQVAVKLKLAAFDTP
jgi:predicted nucleic acid-binding protein